MRRLSALFLALVLTLTCLTQASAETATATITVTGSAVVSVVPDLVTISLGVNTNGATAGAAMTANSEALAKVLARLKASGIADRDIQTSNLSLNPNWVASADGTTSEIRGYNATNILTLQVRAIDKTGAILDAAIGDGANTLNGLTFGLQDPRPKQDEARKLAVADAVARAKLLVDAAGVKLGPIVTISDQGDMQPGPQPMFRMAADAAAVPVAGGEVDISASVMIVFQITQ